MPFRPVSVLVALSLLLPALPAGAADMLSIPLTIRDHKFHPARVEVPAGKRFRLEITNADATPEEFESHALNREKVIPGNSKAFVLIGPLKPGTYAFEGEFHNKTARGSIVVK